MNDQRKHFFFWLGVFVFPQFWAWFTLSRAFTASQRWVAFSWLVIASMILHSVRAELADRWVIIEIGYPLIIGWLTIALAVWLVFRIGWVPATIIEVIVGTDALACAHPIERLERLAGTPFAWPWLIPPFILAMIHLAIEPVQRWTQRYMAEASGDD